MFWSTYVTWPKTDLGPCLNFPEQFNYAGLCIPIPSRLNIPVWFALVQDYKDSVICDFLEFGWPLGYTSQTLPLFHL